MGQRALEKRVGKVPRDELREEAARIMGPIVENVVRNVESFRDWLKRADEASELETLAQLKKQVEGC